MPKLKIQGLGTIKVGDDFATLSPQEQNNFVSKVIAEVQKQQLGQMPQQSTQPQNGFNANTIAENRLTVGEDIGQMDNEADPELQKQQAIAKGRSYYDAVFGGLSQGLSYGFADEVTGGAKQLGDRLSGGERGYRELKAEGSENFKKAAEEHPFIAGASELVGSVVSPLNKILLPIKAAKDAGKMAKVGGQMLQGAVGGGAYAYGKSEGANATEETLGGAAIGAIFNPIISAGLSRIARKATPKSASERAESSLGDDGAVALLAKNIKAEKLKQASEELSGAGPQTAGIDLQDDSFKNLIVSSLYGHKGTKEIAKDFAKGRADKALARIGEALNIVSESKSGLDDLQNLKMQRKAAADPLYEEAKKFDVELPRFKYKTTTTTESPLITKISKTSKKADTTSKAKTNSETQSQYQRSKTEESLFNGDTGTLTTKGESSANVLREALVDKSIDSGASSRSTSQTKTIAEGEKLVTKQRKAINEQELGEEGADIARRIEAIEDNPLITSVNRGLKALGVKSGKIKTSKDLADIKTVLGEMYPKVEGKRSAAVSELFKEVDSIITQVNPKRKAADKIYKEFSGTIESIERGLKYDKMAVSEVKDFVNKASNAELAGFRAGVKENMMDSVLSKTKVYTNRFGKSKGAEELLKDEISGQKLNALFKDKPREKEKLIASLREEIKFNQTIDDLGLESFEQAKNKTNWLASLFGRAVAASVTNSPVGLTYEVSKAGTRALLKEYPGLNEKSAKALVKAFTNKKDSIKLLEKAIKAAESKTQKDIMAKVASDVAPALSSFLVANKFGAQESYGAETMTEQDILRRRQLMQQQIPSSYRQAELEKVDPSTMRRFYNK